MASSSIRPRVAAPRTVRIVERLRPLRRLRDLRAAQVAVLSETMTVQPGDVRRLTTAEGEHAALYKLTAEAGADTVQLVMGVVFADDFMTTIDSMCAVPQLAAHVEHTVEHLTVNLPLGLGIQRRRRYEYHQPEGWQPIVKPHSVSWYPRDFPKTRAVIRVFDAVPARDTPTVVLARRMFDDPQNDLSAVTDSGMMDMRTDTGLLGVIEVTRGAWSDGSPSAMVRVTLQQGNYAYNMRLETSEPFTTEAQAIFQTLIRSVMPLPTPTVEEDSRIGRLIHWAD